MITICRNVGAQSRARRRWLAAGLLLVWLAPGFTASASGQVAAARGAAVPPHPSEVFGFEPGADYKLADHAQILTYFRKLDEASERVRVVELGRSVLGRPLLLAFISSESNLRELERWRAVSERLARARDLDDVSARHLANQGKVVVWIDGGLHASEVAHAQHTPLLAYTVATSETDEMQRIREHVILLLMPVMNPDGLGIVTGWYRRHLGTAFETADLPQLYHHYVGHDNNRDWYSLLQPESRAVARVLYHEWYPQIVYNHHQTAPFPARIFVPPFADPTNPLIPPLVVRGVNLVGDAMTRRLTQEGKSGAVSRIGFDMWWNGGMRTAPYFHNMVGILTETALYEYATPKFYHPDSIPRRFERRGTELAALEPSTFYPDPWRGGWWRLRDAVDYMHTASLAVLDIAARLKDDWLYNMYVLGKNALEQGRAGNPFAYLIPPSPEQWDAGESVELINMLRRGGVEVQRATAPFDAGGKRYAAGSYIIYATQPFRAYILDLLEKQVYPDRRQYAGGPPVAPYDMAGWTLPIQMGVTVARIDSPFEARTEPVDSAALPAGRVTGTGRVFLLSHQPNASVLAVNRLLRAGESVSVAAAAFEVAGAAHPAGTFVIRGSGARTRARVAALARELGLDFTTTTEPPAVALHALRPVRIGLYKSWVANMDEGWTRWLLEQYEFAVDTLHDKDIRAGELARYAAIVLPDQEASRILNGHAPGTMPPEYTGGLGVEGALALKRYVERGGIVVALDGAADFAIDQFGLPVRNPVRNVSNTSFYIPGSLIGLEVDTAHPIAFGMPAAAAAFYVDSRAFEGIEPAREGGQRAAAPRVEIVARYPKRDLLLSGWAIGEERHIGGKPAVLRAELGKGAVVLIGFRAQFRAQPRATFKLLFNALQHGRIPASAAEEELAGAR